MFTTVKATILPFLGPNGIWVSILKYQPETICKINNIGLNIHFFLLLSFLGYYFHPTFLPMLALFSCTFFLQPAPGLRTKLDVTLLGLYLLMQQFPNWKIVPRANDDLCSAGDSAKDPSYSSENHAACWGSRTLKCLAAVTPGSCGRGPSHLPQQNPSLCYAREEKEGTDSFPQTGVWSPLS